MTPFSSRTFFLSKARAGRILISMDAKKQRIAIAKRAGWTSNDDVWFRNARYDGDYVTGELPDYLRNLDAMHEAESFLDEADLSVYESCLRAGCDDDGRNVIRATAAQKAEAFLRAVGVWHFCIADIKKGDRFWERDSQFEALEDGYMSGVFELPGVASAKQWSVKGKRVGGDEIIGFLVTEGAECYGPRLDTRKRAIMTSR